MNERHDDRDWLAAGFVLGTLDDAERIRAHKLIADDGDFARAVDEWNLRLIALADTVDEDAPSPEVWARIDAAVAEVHANDPEPGSAAAPRYTADAPSLWDRVAFWRWTTGLAAATAAVLAVYTGIAPAPEPVQPERTRFVAFMDEGPVQASLVVTVDLESARVTIRPLTDLIVDDQSLELWMLPASDAAPQSLGLLDPDGDIVLAVGEEMAGRLPGAAALAVSLEPLGGSPTGLPTGPVVFQGTLVALPD